PVAEEDPLALDREHVVGGVVAAGERPLHGTRLPRGVASRGESPHERESHMSPDTIVLIHGFWVTPRSWEGWIARYEGKGYKVLAPPYPGFGVEVEALNADPTPIEKLRVPEIIESLEALIRPLDAPPIIMGHSAGGVFTQV